MIKHAHDSPRPRTRTKELPRADVGYAFISDHSLEKVLMVYTRRSSGLAWSLPGGSREPGETLEETVVRETREETGLVVEGVVAVGERLRNSRVLIATFVVHAVGGEAVKVEWTVLAGLEGRGAVHYGEFLN